MRSEVKIPGNDSLFTPAPWRYQDCTILYAEDIRAPGQSAHEFPMTTARLAANRELVLHCREGEIFDLLKKLNTLLEDPDILCWAYELLKKLRLEAFKKLARQVELEKQALSAQETVKPLENAKKRLTGSDGNSVISRLKIMRLPDEPTRNIRQLKDLLSQQITLMAALHRVRLDGFSVIIKDRCRQSTRPVLEEQHHIPIAAPETASAPPAGYLLPQTYNQDLWVYVICRDNSAQSAVWI